MCIIFVAELAEAEFHGPKVSGTNLFVAPSGDGQVTLYENRVGLDGYEGEPNGAMILPVPSGHPIELLDLKIRFCSDSRSFREVTKTL